MRQARYTDPVGRIWVTTIPDDAPEAHASMGIPYGPPDLAALRLPEDLEVDLHNSLVEFGILTWNDFRKDHQRANAALRKGLAVTLGTLEALYHDEG